MKVGDLLTEPVFESVMNMGVFEPDIVYDFKSGQVVDTASDLSKFIALNISPSDGDGSDDAIVIKCVQVETNAVLYFKFEVTVDGVEEYQDICDTDIMKYFESPDLFPLLEDFSIRGTAEQSKVSDGTGSELTMGDIIPLDVFERLQTATETINMNFAGVYLDDTQTRAKMKEWYGGGLKVLAREPKSIRVTNFISNEIQGYNPDSNMRGIEVCFVSPIADYGVLMILFHIKDDRVSDYETFKNIKLQEILNAEECDYIQKVFKDLI